MKIINKTYVLVLVLIAAAIINLTLFYESQQVDNSLSNSIIKTGDLKVDAESISSLAISVATGNKDDKMNLGNEIEDTDNFITKLEYGGIINDQQIQKIPTKLTPEYNKMKMSWDTFIEKVSKVEKTSVFDQEATNSINYVLQKNSELVLSTKLLSDELSNLDRDYNRHKEIAKELEKSAISIGQLTLLISIGEEVDTQQKLKNERIEFDIGLRKLLGVSTNDIDVESVGKTNEELIPIPRENSNELRMIDPLWEAIQPKIIILEERALLSPDFNLAKNDMTTQKLVLFSNIDGILKSWNNEMVKNSQEGQIVIQVLLLVDVGVFFLVVFIIRQSLLPLGLITNALSEIKEGTYGKKIEYSKTDEVGTLVDTFNVMSNTIKEKDEQSKQTDIAKDEFLAMITHELKTPLVPIQGYADILLSEHLGKLTDKQKERISIIKTSSETLLSIISDLLDAQKLELGQLRMRKETSNIKNTIIEALEDFEPDFQKNKIRKIIDIQDFQMEYDPARIKQVLTNLIKNSLNVVKPETGKIEITMKILPRDIQINVIDNGIGIPIEKQTDLFKKFYQVDATLTREKGGSGLGLSICKGIIENHNGIITVNSVPNQGTTFTITLPINSKSAKSPVEIS